MAADCYSTFSDFDGCHEKWGTE